MFNRSQPRLIRQKLTDFDHISRKVKLTAWKIDDEENKSNGKIGSLP